MGAYAAWIFQCECGKHLRATATAVSRGRKKSCGCRQYDGRAANHNRKSPERWTRELSIWHGKANANARNLSWTLTDEQAWSLLRGDCKYCGASPGRFMKRKGRGGEIPINGIDRVDSNLGYTIENTVPCCKICNLAKNVLSEHEFQKWVFRTALHMGFLEGSIPNWAYNMFVRTTKSEGLGLCH